MTLVRAWFFRNTKLEVFFWRFLKCNSSTEKLFKIASKLTSIVTILANIALAGEHIFQVLGQYS